MKRLKWFIIFIFIPFSATLAELQNNPITTNVPTIQANKPSPAANTVESVVYEKNVKSEMTTVYKQLFTALENNGYFVIFEPNIGKNLEHFATRWGDDYNKNKIKSIRSMIFCSGWYANQISNLDPRLLALCPLHITLYQKDDMTHILFIRPAKIAAGSPAEKVIRELEDDVIRTINGAL